MLVIEQGSLLIITVDNRFNESDRRRGLIQDDLIGH